MQETEVIEPAIWLETPRGGAGNFAVLGLPGLDRMMRSVTGDFRPPPIHHLTGLTPRDAGPGLSVFSMPASPWLQSSAGVFLGGTLGFLSDAPLGGSIITGLPAGVAATTSEFSMSYLRPATVGSKELIATSHLIQNGRSLGLSDVVISDAAGKLLAHGSSRCFLIDFGVREAGVIEPLELPTYETPDPYQRPVVGTILDPATLASKSGLEFYQAFFDGEFAPPPIYHLTGLKPVAAEEGSSTWVMPSSMWMSSPTGMIYGGAIVLLADAVLHGTVTTAAPAGVSPALLDLKVHFLRPVTPDGNNMVAKGRVIHQGRTFVVVQAEIYKDDKKVAVASGSGMLIKRDTPDDKPIEPADELSDETTKRLIARNPSGGS